MGEQSDDIDAAADRGNIPLVVHGGASILAVAAIAASLLIGIVMALIGREAAAFGIGPALGSMLLGQGLSFEVDVLFLGDTTAGIALVPFGMILPLAFLLTRVGFTSAWLSVKRARFLPAAAGGLAAVVASVILNLLSEGELATQFFFIEVGTQLRPLWAVVAGAAPWLLAVLIANSPAAARILRGILVLQVLAVIGLTLFTGYVGIADAGLPVGTTLGVMLLALLGATPISVNIIAALVALPFGGALGVRFGDSSLSVGFYSILAEQTDSLTLWVVLIVGIGGVVLLALRDGTPRDPSDALMRVRTFLIAASVTILPMLLLGRLYGDFGTDLVTDLLGIRGGGSFESSAGSSGQPLRWLLIAAGAGLVHLAVGIIQARRAGLGWASDENLTSVGQDVAKGASVRLRGATERARQAAEAAKAAGSAATQGDETQGDEAHGDGTQGDGTQEPPAAGS